MPNSHLINLFGAPSAGKSTTRAGVFHRLKLLGYNCEEVVEVAKDMVWEERHFALSCQAYVFGKQLRNLERVMGKADIIITDSPILLSLLYMPAGYPHSFKQFVLDMFRKYDAQNYYIHRVKAYNPVGRSQTEDESNALGDRLSSLLEANQIPYRELVGDTSAVEHIVKDITDKFPR